MGEAIKEVELLSRAIEGLRNTVVGISVITTELRPTSRESGHDALLRIAFGDVRAEYAAIIKRYITHETIGGLASQLRRTQPQGILVTHHVTPNQAEKLKQLNVPFYDTAGNAFLNDPPLYVFANGKRPDHKNPKQKPTRTFIPPAL